MKYTWQFKLECVKNYKKGITTPVPEYSKMNQREFNRKVRVWVRVFDIHGVDGLKHKSSNRIWTPEKKYDLIAKVLAGNSIKSTAIEAGINVGELYSWVNKYKQSGYDGLKCLKRGRPRNEESSMITNNNNKPKELSKSEREELIALRRRNEYLEAENAYLKKIEALAIQKTASVKAKKQPSSKTLSKKDID